MLTLRVKQRTKAITSSVRLFSSAAVRGLTGVWWRGAAGAIAHSPL